MRLSVPPASTNRACPAAIASAPEVMARLAEMQAVLTVYAAVERGTPTASAASRATLEVWSLATTVPIMTEPTFAGSMSVFPRRALRASRPRS